MSRDATVEIHSVTFADEGLVIQYIEVPTDVRVEGRVIHTHTLQLHAAHPDYREDMERLHDRAVRTVRNALEDFNESEPYQVPTPDDEDDEEKGMGE